MVLVGMVLVWFVFCLSEMLATVKQWPDFQSEQCGNVRIAGQIPGKAGDSAPSLRPFRVLPIVVNVIRLIVADIANREKHGGN